MKVEILKVRSDWSCFYIREKFAYVVIICQISAYPVFGFACENLCRWYSLFGVNIVKDACRGIHAGEICGISEGPGWMFVSSSCSSCFRPDVPW